MIFSGRSVQRSSTLSRFGDRFVRRAWVIAVSVVVVGLISVAIGSQTKSTSYSADELFIVSASTSGLTQVSGGVATVLEQNDQIIGSVAAATQQTDKAVRDHLKAVNIQATSVVQVTYSAPTRSQVTGGLNALAQTVTGSTLTSAAITQGELALVRGPNTVSKSASLGKSIEAGGLVLGLFIGLIAAITLDRADPRSDSVDDLDGLLPCPVLDVATGGSDDLAAMVLRLSQQLPQPARVEVPVLGSMKNGHSIAALLQATLDRTVRSAFAEPSITFNVTRAEDLSSVAVVGADATVLAVIRGTKVDEVSAINQSLLIYDRTPKWALLVPTSYAMAPAFAPANSESFITLRADPANLPT